MSSDTLSFVKHYKRPARPTDFWSVVPEPDENYTTACRRGADTALELLDHLRSGRDAHSILQCIAIDQAKKYAGSDAEKGHMVGFWQTLKTVIAISLSDRPNLPSQLREWEKERRAKADRIMAGLPKKSSNVKKHSAA